ncbi:TetR/AcrR family transcriptional regulator [Phytomonospora endophytica]|uniref:AcrR family transcriptional regulator n=1 Tax=Phytomonospora endophytica TaxID=714109 RepID=A0A841FWI1_9ACTN|nr:TetR/AcrR family transcriptional regulator [Phytomonospora endophytica]MBB6036330.1 AcrR family transcriptional regulator [Phytomonospora endophytica]GIG67237.1 TetR family transcriptional regulator [Phytomonospora endophytica]
MTETRARNRRGQGELLRAEIESAAMRLLDELGDDEALSLRAVAREVGIAATSVYLHFADRDALVLAVLRRFQRETAAEADAAEASAADPLGKLRARVLRVGASAHEHAGLYKVLHESALNRRVDMSFKRSIAEDTTAAVRRCMDAGAIPDGDAEEVSLDLRAAVHGAVSMRVNQPDATWPPLAAQIERLLRKITAG